MKLAKGILYTTAAVGLLALYGNSGRITPFFLVVHVGLFALGALYLVQAARERK